MVIVQLVLTRLQKWFSAIAVDSGNYILCAFDLGGVIGRVDSIVFCIHPMLRLVVMS